MPWLVQTWLEGTVPLTLILASPSHLQSIWLSSSLACAASILADGGIAATGAVVF